MLKPTVYLKRSVRMGSPHSSFVPVGQTVRPTDGPTLTNGTDGRLRVEAGGRVVSVVVRRCFPWSEPGKFISLRDDENVEIVLVEDPSSLDEQSRLVLEQALAAAGFVLEVTRVIAVDEEIEIRQWKVETRQGDRTFQTRLDDWPRVLPGGGVLIRDVAGDLYRLGDVKQLDKRSRDLLWAFVD